MDLTADLPLADVQAAAYSKLRRNPRTNDAPVAGATGSAAGARRRPADGSDSASVTLVREIPGPEDSAQRPPEPLLVRLHVHQRARDRQSKPVPAAVRRCRSRDPGLPAPLREAALRLATADALAVPRGEKSAGVAAGHVLRQVVADRHTAVSRALRRWVRNRTIFGLAIQNRRGGGRHG